MCPGSNGIAGDPVSVSPCRSVPLIVVVCGLRGKHSSPGGSHFPAIQNMLLAARALGLHHLGLGRVEIVGLSQQEATEAEHEQVVASANAPKDGQ